MLAVGCLLHDVGLTAGHEDPDRAFEFVSADRAAGLSEDHGWELPRRYTMHRAIVLHMAPSLPPAEEAEVVLLEAGVACDVTGGHKNDIHSAVHRAILSAFPRPRFADYFMAAMQAQAHRHPGSHAALLMGAGLAESARLHQEWSRAAASPDVTA
jgi:hypothetical protein